MDLSHALKASSLKPSEVQKKAVMQAITNIHRTIENEIRSANSSGARRLAYKMPGEFGIPNMDYNTSRRKICYGLIVALRKCEFEVGLAEDDEKRITFHIRWGDDADEAEEQKEMNTIIAHYMKPGTHP